MINHHSFEYILFSVDVTLHKYVNSFMKPQTLDGLANGKILNLICMLFSHITYSN